MKELVASDAPKRIKGIQFGVLSQQEIVEMSQMEVIDRSLYQQGTTERKPMVGGPNDQRLGIWDKSATCQTCGHHMSECIGHFGYIKLVLPVYHVGFFKHIVQILQIICKSCSAVLLDEEDRRKYLKAFRRPQLENLARTQTFKKVNQAARKVLYCPYCGALNGTVKKVTNLRIVHERFRNKKAADEQRHFHKSFDHMISTGGSGPGSGGEIKQHLSKAHEDLNALKVMELFKRISDEDCELLGLRPEHGRPEEYIWQYVCVPPVCIRPAVAQEANTNEDDLTIKIAEIVFANALVKTSIARGAPISQLMEQWDFVQTTVALYINSEQPGLNLGPNPGKPIRGFCQRLKGKTGRFRGNLSGKRVDFSGRTVISPDPNLKIDEVAVPERVAKVLTYPEKVFEHNMGHMRQAVLNGANVHPGANFIVDGRTGFKRMIKFMANREDAAKNLKYGDIVERHIRDGDIVLFNRQPSLHKLSIMSHRVKVRPWRTFRLNECACNPYNADFDGDEMNMHVPQTEEARTEATILMGVKHNLVTPRNGEPLIAAIQDFITASFLISNRDRFFDRKQFAQVCSTFGDATMHIDIPQPAILKPVRLWTGKQVFSCLIRPNKKERNGKQVLVNLEAKCRTFEKPNEGYIDDMSPNDGYLVIQNSEVMCGVMDKATVGDGKKNSVFGVMLRDYGTDVAIEAMNRLAKMCARWLANQGFSLGINDVMPGHRLRTTKDAKVETAYTKCLDLIEKAKVGKLTNLPGCDQEQTLESEISGVLSDVRGDVGKICMTELSRHNAPLVMAVCGSKGSQINVAQMVACVGQQIIAGSRVPNGFQDRSLPHFAKKSKDPPSKGFVRNSFFSGLTPTEFLFHAISGREGLVDTAVKTAETGYMARRLMKALEDLSTHYDTSVRNSVGGVVQFIYGDDGLDPAELEGDALPVEYQRSWKHAKAITMHMPGRGLMPYEIKEFVDRELASSRFTKETTEMYRQQIRGFISEHVVKKAAAIREAHGLYPAEDREEEWDEDTDLTMGADYESRVVVDNKTKIKEVSVKEFLDLCWVKYMRAKVEPGTAVGAVGAQSIGEPGTQMTLKTFHFAGVASMNVTLGVPRIKEIINAAKVINTPIIETKLVSESSEAAARIVKGRIEKTYLADVTSVFEEVWDKDYAFIGVHIDMDTIRKLQLEISPWQIARAIRRAPRLRLTEERVQLIESRNRIRIYVDRNDENSYNSLKTLKRELGKIVISGITECNRAVVSNDKGVFKILVEGYGFKQVMTTLGVVGTHTQTNHVMDMRSILGIEAARTSVFNEIQTTMKSHGMSIDPRHVMLLADIMTYKGEVLGITRFGVAKMKDSVLMLASFEKTTDHLFDAALFGKTDYIEGVSESIIMGNPAKGLGTGLPALVSAQPSIPPPRKLLFDR
ncbi:beta and beta-prime subunits of DNA dependent RNA-polymerase [Tilletiaria anomala UBC 951]|uniref:DNA-directed RNA polymerase subunit n=1 Tax=Tilletiaria anomala (strain ATCC 24038 / CBS 436.72 / UBC 951) TaxID=1037660 RepID=A0A066WN95_TILAU|nr:beta and beta-prime subunits of DNA dependent RNA-polymerase [Tilletiaria anomala UBC 951]KDN52100.1 beta and beta-prime subunits of DNA dependent RNA-polymerase [Tilletiaria anomala UBC 951]